MKEKSKIYINKTYKYLLPCIEQRDKKLIGYIKKMSPIGYFIGYKKQSTENIYILCEKTDIDKQLRAYIKMEKNYRTGFTIKKGSEKLWMIVLSFPRECMHSFNLFLEGFYSQMYNKNERQEFYFKENVKKILDKEEEALQDYREKLVDEFRTPKNLSLSWVKDHFNYDTPPLKSKEIFNYEKEENDEIYTCRLPNILKSIKYKRKETNIRTLVCVIEELEEVMYNANNFSFTFPNFLTKRYNIEEKSKNKEQELIYDTIYFWRDYESIRNEIILLKDEYNIQLDEKAERIYHENFTSFIEDWGNIQTSFEQIKDKSIYNLENRKD